ncbi:MAG: cadherin-like beta sandwich domain-containing protein [Bacilli bacterium]
MKRSYFVIFLIGFVLFSGIVNASSVSVKASNTSITKGNSVTITATINSDSPLVSTEGTLMCKGAGVSSGVDMTFDDSSNSIYSKSFSTTIKPSSSGTVTCSVTSVRITNMSSDNWQNLGDGVVSIKVNEPAYIPPKNYSSNNYLKSLEVEGYSFDFDKETMEYSIEVPHGVEKVNIKAIKEDNNAKILGNGEVSVSEGTNKLEVKVTAENGNERIYIINVTVKELDPINVKIENKSYTVIRKEGVIEDIPENYEKSSIKIGEEDVLCYKNVKTGNILIGLKDDKGEARFYSYDEKTRKYTLYNGYKIGGLYLNIISMPKDKIPSGYSKVSFNYGDNKLEGYQPVNNNVTYAADDSVKGSDFYLVYAINEVTGEAGTYMYDKLDGTIQRFNSSLILTYKEKADNYLLYFLLSLVVLATTIITFVIILMKKKKHKNKFA